MHNKCELKVVSNLLTSATCSHRDSRYLLNAAAPKQQEVPLVPLVIVASHPYRVEGLLLRAQTPHVRQQYENYSEYSDNDTPIATGASSHSFATAQGRNLTVPTEASPAPGKVVLAAKVLFDFESSSPLELSVRGKFPNKIENSAWLYISLHQRVQVFD